MRKDRKYLNKRMATLKKGEAMPGSFYKKTYKDSFHRKKKNLFRVFSGTNVVLCFL